MNSLQSHAECVANRAISHAIDAVVDADRLSAEAQYGSEVRSALSQAAEALSYALKVAEGRT